MLKGNESISHYSLSNIVVWMTMAFQAGLINIGGYMACRQFVSHVTGYATLFGIELSKTRHNHALSLLAVPVFFLIGSMISGVLVDLQMKQHKKPRYYIPYGIIFFLILLVWIGGAFGYFGIFGLFAEQPKDYLLLAILCLICGIQNGMITSVSKSVVRTTHLTGITTDLGIGIIRILNKDKLQDITDEKKANYMRIGLIAFFVIGSIIGSYSYLSLEYNGFFLPALSSGILFLTTLYYQLIKPNSI